MLVTERAGKMRIVSADGKVGVPLTGVPAVHAVGQGGLLDIFVSPDFAQSHTIYFSFAQPVAGGARTRAARRRVWSSPFITGCHRLRPRAWRSIRPIIFRNGRTH